MSAASTVLSIVLAADIMIAMLQDTFPLPLPCPKQPAVTYWTITFRWCSYLFLTDRETTAHPGSSLNTGLQPSCSQGQGHNLMWSKTTKQI